MARDETETVEFRCANCITHGTCPRSTLDILKCLQGTIDVYDALARQDFDRLFDKAPSEPRSTSNDTIRTETPPVVSTAAAFPVRAAPTTTTLPSFDFTKPVSTAADPPASTGFSFKLPTATPEKSTSSAPFAFSIPNTGFGTVSTHVFVRTCDSFRFCSSQHSVRQQHPRARHRPSASPRRQNSPSINPHRQLAETQQPPTRTRMVAAQSIFSISYSLNSLVFRVERTTTTGKGQPRSGCKTNLPVMLTTRHSHRRLPRS